MARLSFWTQVCQRLRLHTSALARLVEAERQIAVGASDREANLARLRELVDEVNAMLPEDQRLERP